MSSKYNWVAKHMNTFNKSVIHRDRKNAYTREQADFQVCLDEWEDEQLELLTEDLETES